MGNIFNTVAAALVALIAFGPNAAFAHASDQGFVLLLPTTFYVTAGTLSVVASIILVTCLGRGFVARFFSPVCLSRRPQPEHSLAVDVTSAMAGIALFALIAIGFFGPTDPQSNLLPLSFWTLWWMLIFVFQGTVFDVWRWINPWSGLARLMKVGDEPLVELPKTLGVWPALALFILFEGFLLADIAPNDPKRLAFVILSYWGASFIGIAIFGRVVWLGQVECVSVLFNLLSRLRPMQGRPNFSIGMPGWKALAMPAPSASLAIFCLTVLAAGSFDGINETFWWLARIGVNPLEFPGRSAVWGITLIGLLASIIALIAIYAVAIWIGVCAAKAMREPETPPFRENFKAFAITLLPIALGYHIAHYYVSFLVQIRVTLSTAADPLARGWDLLGLSAVKVTTGFLNTPETVKVIWLTQAGVVIASHIFAVLMCHRIAEQKCRTFHGVIAVQFGITILMVAYTVFGLWLLASPRGA